MVFLTRLLFAQGSTSHSMARAITAGSRLGPPALEDQYSGQAFSQRICLSLALAGASRPTDLYFSLQYPGATKGEANEYAGPPNRVLCD